MDEISAAQKRWVSVGPYYGTFPTPYVERVIREHTQPADAVLDPFAGRFSATSVSSYLNRPGLGIEINPLGWLYGSVKLNPADDCEKVVRRLQQMADASANHHDEARNMDEFFRMCYAPNVLRFLIACRSILDWRTSPTDATLMASIMVSLHDNRGKGLSNQMRQMRAMAPGYSVRWWKRHRLHEPPQVDPVALLSKRIRWRYAHGAFRCPNGEAVRGDCCTTLRSPRTTRWVNRHGGVKLLFTSPPYWSLVNYFRDQWLRLWMLGEDPTPAERTHPFEKRFGKKDDYRQLIQTAFASCANLMRDDGVVVVRMDQRRFTQQTIQQALATQFPNYRKIETSVSAGKSQTGLFNGGIRQPGERDIVLAAPR